MEVVQIVGIGLVAGMLITVLRQQKPELALQISIAAAALLFLLMVSRIMQVVDVMQTLSARARVDQAHMGAILKIIGIAYVTDFGSQVLQDAGEKSVASKVEMAGKILIILLALPILLAIMDTVLKLLE